jgi:hypothetical protein
MAYIDETLPSKKRGKQGTKWKDPCPRRQMNHLREQTTQRDIKFSNPTSPPVVARRISNKERGGPPARRPNLHKPSPTATACLKMEISRLHLIL